MIQRLINRLAKVKQNIISRRPWSLLTNVLLIFVVFFVVSAWQAKDAIRGEAPIIVGQLLDGRAFNMNAYRGKPLLVHFWATWCPICKLENSQIDAIAKDYSVLTIAAWSESEVEIADFLTQQKLQMPVLVDSEGDWASAYGVKAVPTSFILDPQGVIQFVETGYTTELGLRFRLWWLEN